MTCDIKHTEADTCRTMVTPHLLAEQHYFTDVRIVVGHGAKRWDGRRAFAHAILERVLTKLA